MFFLCPLCWEAFRVIWSHRCYSSQIISFFFFEQKTSRHTYWMKWMKAKRLKPRLCSHHMRLSLFLHIVKSCPYLDWSRASLLLRVLSMQVCSSTHLQRAGHPWISRYFPCCADGWKWKLGLSSSLPILRGQVPQDEHQHLAGWQKCMS